MLDAALKAELIPNLSRERLAAFRIEWERDHEPDDPVAPSDEEPKRKLPKRQPIPPVPVAYFAVIPKLPTDLPAEALRDLQDALSKINETFTKHNVAVLTQIDRETALYEKAWRPLWEKAERRVRSLAKQTIIDDRKRLRKKHPKMSAKELRTKFEVFHEEYDLTRGEGGEEFKEILEYLGKDGRFEQIREEAYGEMGGPELGPHLKKLSEAKDLDWHKVPMPEWMKKKPAGDFTKFK